MSVQKEVYLKHLTYLGPELLNHVLALQVPDLDGGAGGGAQPVPGQDSVVAPRGSIAKIIRGLSGVRGVKYIPAQVQLEDLDPRVNLASSFTDRAWAEPGVRDAGVGEPHLLGLKVSALMVSAWSRV